MYRERERESMNLFCKIKRLLSGRDLNNCINKIV